MNLPPPEPIDIAAEVRAMRHELHELRDRQSLRKNGGSFGHWLSKFVTPANAGWLVVAAFLGYGEWRDMQTNVRSTIASAAKAAKDSQAAIEAAGHVAAQIQTLQVDIREERQMYATKLSLDALSERVRLAVTRREFQEFQRTVLPSLQRIEKSVDGR